MRCDTISVYDPFQQPQLSVELFFTLYKSSISSVRKLEEKLEPLGLTLGRLCLLYALQKINKPALPSELGDDLAVTRANISGLLRGLEKLEMVHRELDTTDRRRVLVHLTSKGKETLHKAWPIYEETVTKLFHPFNVNEQTLLLSMLKKVDHRISDT